MFCKLVTTQKSFLVIGKRRAETAEKGGERRVLGRVQVLVHQKPFPGLLQHRKREIQFSLGKERRSIVTWKKFKCDRRTKWRFKWLWFIQPHRLTHFFQIANWQGQLQYLIGEWGWKVPCYASGNSVSAYFILRLWLSSPWQRNTPRPCSFQNILDGSSHQG